MKLQELIQSYKKQTGLNNEAIAKALGVSKSTITRYLNGEIGNLKYETKQRLNALLKTDVDEVLSTDVFTFTKPILGYVKAGYNLYADEDIIGYLEVNKDDHLKGDYFLKVSGNSMELAHIYDGDLAYIKQTSEVKSGDIAIVLVGEEVTIKKIIYKNDFLILEACNHNVENRYYTQKEVEELPIRIIGKLVYIRRDF